MFDIIIPNNSFFFSVFVLLAESHALVAIGSSVSATHWIVVFVTVTAGSGILSTLDPSEKMVKKN